MSNNNTILDAIESIDLGSESWEEELDAIADIVVGIPAEDGIIEAVFRLFERDLEADFGPPGKLARAIEQLGGPKYDDQLEASIRRYPTYVALSLANRIVNTKCSRSWRFRELIEFTASRQDIDSRIREIAAGY